MVEERKKVLSEETVSEKVKKAQYAIRGTIFFKSQEIKERMKKGEKFPFKQIYPCNIGNPLLCGQPNNTFNREVLSCALNPNLLTSGDISQDAKNRAQLYLTNLPYESALGAYSESHGLLFCRESAKNFIEKRDGYPSDVKHIFLGNGASDVVNTMGQLLLRGPNDGLMIPIPQYPLYSATIAILGAKEVPYYLDEEHGWELDMKNVEAQYKKAKEEGTDVRGMVVINPGNPTGQLLTIANMQEIVKFCYENCLLLMADEVYQLNNYTEEKTWNSFKKVMLDLGPPYNTLELASFHSTSKGVTGECGLRGGYAELINIDPYVEGQFYKLRSLKLCSNTVGHMAVELMTNPPVEGRESKECVDAYNKEVNTVFSGLKEKSKILTQRLNKMDNIHCQRMEGSMYSFPSIIFSAKTLEVAKEKNLDPDLMYCLECLEATGIVIVPGSGFRQKEGTHHFRITNLVYDVEIFKEMIDSLEKFNNEYHKKYA